ncbi:MAG: hypothetical protein IPM51_17085 [Sphingobacteriaceae bacterium]|nr:hypothetical protein [Sphingobacteriaceae bacterium]
MKNSSITSSNFPTKFKFTYDNWIFIKAKLNNSEAEREFMLDTGSPCAYCFRTKDALNLQSKKLVRFGMLKLDYGSSQAQIESIRYNNLAYTVSDMAYCWRKTNSGYIGVNAMQNSIWEFNFKDTTITVSDTLIHFKNIEGASKIRFTPLSEQQTPVIKIVINNGDTITALLDTGNDKILQLNNKFDINKIRLSCSECVQTSYYNINQMGENVNRDSIIEVNYVKANSVKIGDLELKSSLLTHKPRYQGKNLVGLGLFKNFIVTIDWKHYYIYLKPIENGSDMLSKFSYGFKCDKTGKRVKVTEIFRNSLAEKEGIKCGDEILKLNDKTVADLDEKTINSINNEDLYAPDIIIQLKTKEIKLKKERIFSK